MNKPDPTSPAGMSKPEIKRELLDEHGWSHDRLRAVDSKIVLEQHLIEARKAVSDQDYDGLDDFDEDEPKAEPKPIEQVADEVAAFLDEVAAAQPQSLFLGMPSTLDFTFDGHAGAGPSGAERWMNCTASLGAIREFLETLTPNQQHQFAGANEAARQGTTAHAAGEAEINLILGNITPDEHESTLMALAMEPPAGEEYDEDMAEHVNEYVAFIQSYIDAGHEVTVEQRVEALIPLTIEGAYTHVYDDGDTLPNYYSIKGSVDCGIKPTPKHNVLTVVDYKHGNGLDVDVEQNPQIRIYAIGLLGELDDPHSIDAIEYVIVQPRLGGIKSWTESVGDLLAWRDDVLSPALTSALGLDGKAAFAPSDLACQWCPVRGSCPALTAKRMSAASELFGVITEAEANGEEFPETDSLSNEALGNLLSQVDGLVKLKDDLKAEAQRRLHRGATVPGYKLVSYTPARQWTEEAAQKLIKAKRLWKPATLMTPTQAIKVLGDEAPRIEKLIVSPDKRPIIAPESSNKKTWEGRAPEDMFGIETGENT